MALSETEELELLELERERAMYSALKEDVQVPESSFQEINALRASDGSMGSKAWNALNIPAQMSRRGLQDLSDITKPSTEVTGNLSRDLAVNTPSIAFNTLSQVAPSMIDRGAILTAGAAKALKAASPLLKALRKGTGGQVEQLTGSVPGSVNAAWEDPTLIFAKGKKAASPLYEAAKTGSKEAKDLRAIKLKDEFIDTAAKLAEEGKLPPESALEGRKIVGKLLSKGGGKYTEDYLRDLKDTFDKVAKSSEQIAKADPVHQRGVFADSLRNIFPQNKYGGASAFKLAIMKALEEMGPAGKVAGAMMSPLAAGIGATAGGIASRTAMPIATNPAAAVTVRALVQKLQEKLKNK